MKKLVSLLLALCMLLACSSALADLAPGTVINADPSMYANTDLSEHVTLSMVLVGDKPEEWERVMGEINEILGSQYNTTLETTFLSWADYETMYSMTLAGGEDVDIIYTATWCYFMNEAQKGSYYLLDEDFIAKYMPLSNQYQLPETWDQMNVYGGIQGAAKNYIEANTQCMAIRDDLREKYGLEPLENWEDFMNYALTIAEKETPESGTYAYNVAGENVELWYVYAYCYDQQYIGDGYWRYTQDPANIGLPEAEEIEYYVLSDAFANFCHDVKKLADAGCWSRSAINNTVPLYDAFANGTSAALAWNNSVISYMNQADQNIEGAKTAVLTLLRDDQVVFGYSYNGDGMAIAAACEHPERAAMVIDLLKFDTTLNNLACLGIEGEHYINNGDGTYSDGPANAKYPDGGTSLSWAIPNGALTQAYSDPRQAALQEWWNAHRVTCPGANFNFDATNVKAENAAVQATVQEYWAGLTLGLVDDVDATLAEMYQKLEAVGIQKVVEEYRSQYTAWKNAQ